LFDSSAYVAGFGGGGFWKQSVGDNIVFSARNANAMANARAFLEREARGERVSQSDKRMVFREYANVMNLAESMIGECVLLFFGLD
jgi:hypothetical protein